MPLAVPTLYALPSDVYDALGSEGTQLRLDDANASTGQTILATATAAPGATTLAVSPLEAPLLAGTVLVFAGAAMPYQSEVVMTAVGTVGASSLTTAPLAANVYAGAVAIDNGINLAFAYRLTKACQYGTSQVNLYCSTKYDESELAKSPSCNRWATAIAARWLCRRRGQSAPAGIEADAKEAIEEMKAVSVGALRIDNAGMRTSGWPFVSNVHIDQRYYINKIRVEPQMSEGTPTYYGQYVDWSSVLLVEW